MGTLYSVKGGSGANHFLLPIYRPTRANLLVLRPLCGLESDTSRVTANDHVQKELFGPLSIDCSTLNSDGITLLIPNVRRQDAEQGGPPSHFNIWARVWSMGKDTIHVRVDSDINCARQQVGWVTFLAHGASWLVQTTGTVLIQTRAQPSSKVIERY